MVYLALNMFGFMDDFKTNSWIKIGILAMLLNVFVGITKIVFVSINFVLSSPTLDLLLLILETVSFSLLILFAISIILYSNEIQNQTGLYAGATFLIVTTITYFNLYFYPYLVMAILMYINAFIFLLMLATFLYFLLKLSEKYEEPIILIALAALLAAAVLNAIFIYISPIITTLILAIRDFLLFWAFSTIIMKHEGKGQKEKKKDVDYKHVKVKYEE